MPVGLGGGEEEGEEGPDDAAARAFYVERHPSAAIYAGFSDFNLYRVSLARGHFVVGIVAHQSRQIERNGKTSLALFE